MSEHDVETTNPAPDSSKVKPDTVEDDTAQEGQQEESATGQTTETAGDQHPDTSEVSDPAGEDETSESAPAGGAPDNGAESPAPPDDTLTFGNASEIPSGDEDTNSDEFTLSSGDDNAEGGYLTITIGDGNGPETVTVVGGTRNEGDGEGQDGTPPEDSTLVYPEPEPEPPVPPDDNPSNDADGAQSGLPVYKGAIDPRIANIQSQIDLSQLRADDDEDDGGDGDDGEEEELQGIVATPDVERPRVDDQPAPGAGPFLPQPGQAAGLDIFDAKLGGDADGTQLSAFNSEVTADTAKGSVSDLIFGDDARSISPERLQFKPEVLTPRDTSPASDSNDDTLDEAGIFPLNDPVIQPVPADIPQSITNAMFKDPVFPTTDDEEDNDPEDDLDGDF